MNQKLAIPENPVQDLLTELNSLNMVVTTRFNSINTDIRNQNKKRWLDKDTMLLNDLKAKRKIVESLLNKVKKTNSELHFLRNEQLQNSAIQMADVSAQQDTYKTLRQEYLSLT